MNHPDQGLELSEIMRLTGRSQKDVQRALDMLIALELAMRRSGVSSRVPSLQMRPARSDEWPDEQPITRGRTRYYLNRGHSWIAPLRMFLECAVGGLDVLRAKLAELEGIDIAFVFGSYATSEQTLESDIDLVVIGEHNLKTLAGSISEVERRIGKEIQIIPYSPEEWRKRFAERDHFVVSLLDGPKLFLRGSPRLLEELTAGVRDED
jgi:predicted nucleotidyltransferase